MVQSIFMLMMVMGIACGFFCPPNRHHIRLFLLRY